MRRHADRRQPPGDEAHIAAEVVGRAQVDEPALNRRFAEQHRGDRPAPRDLLDDGCNLRVERSEVVHRAAPGDLYLAVARCELRGCEGERAILHHEPAPEHGGEHCRARDDPDSDQDEPLAAARQAGRDESEGEDGATDGLKHR